MPTFNQSRGRGKRRKVLDVSMFSNSSMRLNPRRRTWGRRRTSWQSVGVDAAGAVSTDEPRDLVGASPPPTRAPLSLEMTFHVQTACSYSTGSALFWFPRCHSGKRSHKIKLISKQICAHTDIHEQYNEYHLFLGILDVRQGKYPRTHFDNLAFDWNKPEIRNCLV